MLSQINDKNICKIPSPTSIVYKDECLYCYDTIESCSGLYICMNSFIAVCKKHLDLFYKKSKNCLFLNIRVEKRVKIENGDGVIKETTEYQKLINEAFLKNDVDSKEFNSLLLMPGYEVLSLPNVLPEHITMSVKQILSADSFAKSIERGTQGDNWDGNYIQESKHAWSLEQLNNGVKIAPSGWKCTFCDLTSNLWMNLTDGTILCGRKFFDGSGGNNHAIEYYKQTQYPLAVKLGTITPTGADVFSYAEDDMVTDSLLAKHLAHFGIDIMKMEKTEKNIEELTLERMKLSREQSLIMEADTNQEVLCGPGLTGIVNTGNSCYINSVLQVLLSLPAFQTLYSDNYRNIIEVLSVNNDVTDFRVQMAKLGHFLRSGEYSHLQSQMDLKDGEVISATMKVVPQLLRYITGKGHPDFSTKMQQDAFEFLIHVLNMMRADFKKYGGVRNPLESVAFRVEDRFFCETTQRVKYQYRDELVLSLSIALDQATNKDQLKAADKDGVSTEEALRPIVNLQSCLELYTQENLIDDYTVNGQRGVAFQSSKLDTFPEYLWIHLKRFTVGSDWTPKKLDVEIEVPDKIDLSHMAAKGLQPTETELREEVSEVKVELNQVLVNHLTNMGFPDNACKKAVYLTGNSSLDEAANWLMLHIGEPDFEELPAALLAPSATYVDAVMPEEDDIDMMVNMGFTRQQGIRALQETGNLERAADWAFNHPEELDKIEAQCALTDSGSAPVAKNQFQYATGAPTYSLAALISHMGNNAHVGHYVCHIKQADGSWVLFNDDVVQRSVHPPKKFAYLYLFKRDVQQ